MTTTKITRTQATRSLEAIRTAFATYLEPLIIDGKDYGPTCTDGPVLIEDYDGEGWAIIWEDGPFEWAFCLDGSPNEEEYALTAAASREFGSDIAPSTRPAFVAPKGVWVEPIYSFALALLPA